MADGASAATDAPERPCRLLCVDDDPLVLTALRRLFKQQHFDVLLAESGAEGLQVLARTPVDVVIADMRMPEMNGAQFLEAVRVRWPETIRFLLTAHADLDSTVAAINRGGISRYLSKPWDREELLEAVRQAMEDKALQWRRQEEQQALNDRLALEVKACNIALVVAQDDIAKLRAAQERAAYLAHHDALTGLPNRLLFMQCLQHAIDRAERRGELLAIVFIDLDRFKAVNDRFGHAAGDAVLQDAARAMQSALRRDDMLARFGGDEFVGLLESIQSEAAALAADEKLLAVFPRQAAWPAARIAIGASIGLSLYPRDGRNPMKLIGHADAAMYRAKADRRAARCPGTPLGT